MIDNNAFGVGAAAAVPTAGTPHSKNRVAAATDESVTDESVERGST